MKLDDGLDGIDEIEEINPISLNETTIEPEEVKEIEKPLEEKEIKEENVAHRKHNLSLAKKVSKIEEYLDSNPIPKESITKDDVERLEKMNMRMPKMAIATALLISIISLIISLVRLV